MTTNTDHEALQQRLTELEIKASYTDVLLEQLDQVVIRQQHQIDALVRELTGLRQMAPETSSSAAQRMLDELPPHF